MTEKLDVDRVIGGVALLAVHKIDVLARHRLLARQSCAGLLGLRHWQHLRLQQWALQQRLRLERREHRRIRGELWRGLRRDL